MNDSLEVTALDSPATRDLWSTNRVEALSDGVFAIVMTLLVLELKVPALPRDAPAAEIWQGVRQLGPIFFSYFVTFALAGTFWYWHHKAFDEIEQVDGLLFALNLGFLSFVSLLPFSTAILGAFRLRQPVSLGCYFGNLLGMAILLIAFWSYATRAGLVVPTSDPRSRRRILPRVIVQAAACVVALATLPFDTSLTMNIYAFVLLAGNFIIRWTMRPSGGR
jgi:uncharacterized membrane protein